MSKTRICGIFLLVFFCAVFVFSDLFGGQIYQLITPNVKAVGIKIAIWDNIKYTCVIEKDNIYEDENGQYVYLIKKDISFWYTKYHLERGDIRVLSENGSQVAVEFISPNYKSGDMVVDSFIDSAEFFSDVCVIQ